MRGSTDVTHSGNVIGSMATRPFLIRLLVALVLTLLLVACSTSSRRPASSAPPSSSSSSGSPIASSTTSSVAAAIASPTTAPTSARATSATATPQPGRSPTAQPPTTTPTVSVNPDAAVVEAIKSVIQKGNQEQQQAVAAHDPTIMQDTATPDYYAQLVQVLNDLTNGGVTAIQLVNLQWGAITLQGVTTAQATTVETWNTILADSSTAQSTDTNVYTLVLHGGAWKVQDDQHPDSRRLQPAAGTPGTSPSPVATLAPVGPNQSRNWAGYIATGGTFTSVSGTWAVPTVTPGTTVAADATWVGIGGVSARDLIQAGTDVIVESGQVTYTAWVETLPQAAQNVPLVVSPGDQVSVTISQQADGTWHVVISNVTTGQSYEDTITYASSNSSAEWVEESPVTGRQTLLPLDDFGTISFSAATTVEDSARRTIAEAHGEAVTMTNRQGQPLAQPSPLGDDGSSFTVTRATSSAP